MSLTSLIRSLFSIPRDNPELLRSQARAFSRQVPLLYFILVINTLALTSTQIGTAPAVLTIWAPLILYAGSIFRLVKWWRLRNRELSDAEIVAMLRGTIRFSFFLGIGFTIWALSLYPYGDAYAQSFVPFYMAVTVICIILCLMHMRAAAFIVTSIVIPAYAIFFGLSGNPVFVAMALNVCLVAGGLVFMVQTNYRDFANLIEVQKKLVAKQEETQRLVDENFRLANIDSLTGLPNRRSFFASLNALAQGSDSVPFAIAVIDLDGFKPVNDLFGHSTGDKVLIEVGERMSAFTSDTVLIARLGGDEFGMIVKGDDHVTKVETLGLKLCEVLREPYRVPEAVVQISATAGFAAFHCEGDDPQNLLERADCALYHAKNNKRGSAVMFSQAHEEEMRKQSRIEQALRNADFVQEFEIAYQPIHDIKAGKLVAFEALARWTSPSLGKVPPDQFIPIAERTGIILTLTEYLLREALDTVSKWPEEIGLSFNLSACDIASPQSVETLINIVQQSGVDPGRIDFEITETAVMRDFEQSCAAFHALREIGSHIALDDFGTGYSSLSYVQMLPLDKLKIDRRFIADLETNEVSRKIVRAIIGLCRNLGLTCIIEGVETAGQLAHVSRMRANFAQGYFFSKPLPSAGLLDYNIDNNNQPQARQA